MQMTLMSIPVCGDVGVEMQPDVDQLLRMEAGQGLVRTGSCRHDLSTSQTLQTGDVVFIPAGTWHNVENHGNCPLKLSSVYAPPQHPHGTMHRTKADAEYRFELLSRPQELFLSKKYCVLGKNVYNGFVQNLLLERLIVQKVEGSFLCVIYKQSSSYLIATAE